jgi:gas vesicle protein
MTDVYSTGSTTRPSRVFAWGVMSGVVLGAATALLCAPATGVELRGQLARSAGRARRRATEAGAHAADVLRRTAQEASQFLSHNARPADRAVDSLSMGERPYPH